MKKVWAQKKLVIVLILTRILPKLYLFVSFNACTIWLAGSSDFMTSCLKRIARPEVSRPCSNDSRSESLSYMCEI